MRTKTPPVRSLSSYVPQDTITAENICTDVYPIFARKRCRPEEQEYKIFAKKRCKMEEPSFFTKEQRMLIHTWRKALRKYHDSGDRSDLPKNMTIDDIETIAAVQYLEILISSKIYDGQVTQKKLLYAMDTRWQGSGRAWLKKMGIKLYHPYDVIEVYELAKNCATQILGNM